MVMQNSRLCRPVPGEMLPSFFRFLHRCSLSRMGLKRCETVGGSTGTKYLLALGRSAFTRWCIRHWLALRPFLVNLQRDDHARPEILGRSLAEATRALNCLPPDSNWRPWLI